MNDTKNYQISGNFSLKSPLSHIGESISTTTFLVEEPIVQPDNSIEKVFVYSGNAWRGQLRDLSAMFMLDKLGIKVPVDAFHLFFSGGKIGGDMKVNPGLMRRLRDRIPMLAIFGGGVGTMMMPGKMCVANSYTICKESQKALPFGMVDSNSPSYADLTVEKSFSRKDDSKDDGLITRCSDDLTDGDGSHADDVATQMRMTSELLVAGSELFTVIDLFGVTEAELGVLVSAFREFGKKPYIGGQNNRGHGRTALGLKLTDMDTGETVDLFKVDEDVKISKRGQKAIDALEATLEATKEALELGEDAELMKAFGASA